MRRVGTYVAVAVALVVAREPSRPTPAPTPTATATTKQVAIVPAIAPPIASPAPAPTVLHVRVTSAGEPVADAEVQITDGSQPMIATVRTDRAGNATFADLPPGPYELWATRPSLASPIVRVADLTSRTPTDLALDPAGTVRGRVVGDGLPASAIPAAVIRLVPLDLDHAVRTATLAADGRFVVDSVPPGHWRVEPAVPGFLAIAEQVIAIGTRGDGELSIRVQRAGAIRGTVVDAGGAPVRNATIVIRHQGPRHTRLPEAPPVGARLRWVFPIAGRRQLPTNEAARFGASRPGARPAECGDGHCGIDLVMPKGTVVHATADGIVVGAYTELRGEAGRYVAIDHGNGQETMYLHLDQVRPGLLAGQRIRAGDPVGTVGSSGFDPTRAPAHLHFALAQHHDGRTLYLDPEPLLRHAVVLPVARSLDEAEPAVFAAIARDDRGPPVVAADEFTTDAHGAFRIDGIEPGAYAIVAYAADLAPGASDAIAVASGAETSGVVVTLHLGTEVCGRIEDRDGPLAGATIVASTGAGETTSKLATTYTNGEGVFVLRALAGGVTLAASAPNHAELVRTIVVEPGRTCRRESFTLMREDAQLRGQVFTPDGDATGVVVRIVDGPSRRSTGVDARGQFVIASVARGSYVVEVSSPSSPQKRVALDSDRWQDIRLELGGRIHAMIGDARSGTALAGIRVDATGPDRTTVTRTSDARGVVDLAGLAEGDWTLAIRARGYAPLVRIASAHPSRVALDVHLELARGATLAGIVRDRRGGRVAGARVSLGAATTQSDVDGNFVLVDAPIGAAVVEASLGDARGSLALELAPGDERMTLNLEIGPAAN